jgi:hypothetical protein
MAKINLDLSKKVDFECLEGDSLTMQFDMTDTSGGTFDISDDEEVLFYIYKGNNDPVALISSAFVVDSGYPSSVAWASPTPITVANLIGWTDINVQYFDYENEDSFFVANDINGEDNNCILLTSGRLQIEINPNSLLLRQGSYNYSMKVVSLPCQHGSFAGSKTWLEGKIEVIKI